MSIVLQSTGGGQITINEPTTASNFTQTLPAATGEVMVSGNMPAFSAAVSAQSFTAATITKLACNTEQFDTNNTYDSSTNFRFTPNVAGYYQINSRIQVSSVNTTLRLIPYVNGSALLNSLSSTFPTNFDTLSSSWLIYCNGSTDYIEMYVQVGVTQNCAGGFQAFMARGA